MSSRLAQSAIRDPQSAIAPTPAALGFRMPAEWEPQVAVWLSWPHNLKTWPGHFRPIPAKFAEIVARISRFEEVRINIAQPLQARAWSLITRARADLSKVTFHNHPVNDSWCRDHGPIFVKNDRTGEVAVTDWDYNAWGGKYPPFDKDNTIPPKIARALGLRRFEKKMVLEGGSIEVNGAGLLLTTEACLLNKNRNPQLTKEQIVQNLRDYLGVHSVLWLGDGIVGDDTDGHIDDLSRFFSADGIVTVVEDNGRDRNYRVLRENLARLQAFRTPREQEIQDCAAADAAALFLPRPATAGELREFSRDQRRGADARFSPAEAGCQGGRSAGRLFSRERNHSGRLPGSGLGPRNAALYLPAATGLIRVCPLATQQILSHETLCLCSSPCWHSR